MPPDHASVIWLIESSLLLHVLLRFYFYDIFFIQLSVLGHLGVISWFFHASLNSYVFFSITWSPVSTVLVELLLISFYFAFLHAITSVMFIRGKATMLAKHVLHVSVYISTYGSQNQKEVVALLLVVAYSPLSLILSPYVGSLCILSLAWFYVYVVFLKCLAVFYVCAHSWALKWFL